jgi:hypothetical protein
MKRLPRLADDKLMKFLFKNQVGLSIVELMATLAVGGALTAGAMVQFKKFQMRARQVEARQNIAHIYSLHAVQQSTDSSQIACHGKGIICQLTLDNYTNKTSCRNQNNLGFSVGECTRARYVYYASGSNPVYLYALEGKTLFSGPAPWPQRRVGIGCNGPHDLWRSPSEDLSLVIMSNATKNCR